MTETKLSDEKLREILAGTEGVTRGPWYYRPQEHDDWGWVRSAPPPGGGWGWVVATARRGRDEQPGEDDVHRAARTDPYGPNAKHIARLDPDTVKAIVTELLTYREAANEVANASPLHAAALDLGAQQP